MAKTTERTDAPGADRDALLAATLPHVAFDGWTRRAVNAGAADLGLGRDAVTRAFPGGVPELVDHFADWADRRMLDALGVLDLENMRVSDRVAAGVRGRLEALAPHREAVRRLAAYFLLPPNAPLAARLTWRTVDAIWYAAGDESADFNYYTKRGLLAPVYTTTVLYWLADSSDGFADTWGYLDRRISDVLKIPALKGRLGKALANLPNPLPRRRRARG